MRTRPVRVSGFADCSPVVSVFSSETSTGMEKRKVEPTPGALLTEMDPSIMSDSSLQIANPRPAPLCARDFDESACLKRSKRTAWSCFEIPIPVSLTSSVSLSCPFSSSTSMLTATTPRCVNLIALPTRLIRTWRILPTSDLIALPEAFTSFERVMPFFSANGLNTSVTIVESSTGSKTEYSKSISPASMRDKSSKSSIRVRRVSAERSAAFTRFAVCSFTSARSTSDNDPITPFNGVRIS